MPGPTTHSRLGPSSSNRWIPCPYSLNAPPEPGTAATAYGTIAHDWASKTITYECDISEVPQPYRDGVGMYSDHVLSHAVKPIVEQKLESLTLLDFGGTVDCLLVEDGKCAIYDFKFGKWPVAAKDNSQMLCYAVLAAEHFELTEFHGVIVQPNTWESDKIKQAEYSLDQVNEHREKIERAAVSDYKATGDHCRFCPFRKLGECAEGAAYAKRKGWKK